MKSQIACLLLIFAVANAAQAANKDSGKPARPSEDAMFGSASSDSTTAQKSDADQSQDERGLDVGKAIKDAFTADPTRDNPLQIGGLYYQRLMFSGQDGVTASNSPISMPLQFDLFLDARPSDRVRGFVDERLLYDSTLNSFSQPTKGSGLGSTQFSSGSGAPSGLGSLVPTAPNNPQTVLDQAWLKFDMDRTVFVTVGKQHLKWGTSRFWNPTDFLNTQIRDPLLPYDLRLGNTMVKFDIPWEAKRMNFYAISLFDNPQPASTAGQLGEALRMEKVIGNGEFGIDAVTRGGITPVYGADFSAPLGPFDIYGEASYLTSSHYPIYRTLKDPTSGDEITADFAQRTADGPIVQVSGGINYSFAWKENRQATFGIEYFYNDIGYTDTRVYPVLMFSGQFQPFYTGRNYAAFYLTAEGPDTGKHTNYTLSTLGNLSDSSYISRLDFSWNFLTYLTLGAFADCHYGRKGGEFNFALNTPAVTYLGNNIPAIAFPSTIFDLGAELRLSF